MKRGETIELPVVNVTDPLVTTEKNPYMNYSGEYGKEFNHYVKMGLNESGVQESIDKIVEIEYKEASKDIPNEVMEDVDGYIILDVPNELEPLKHPQYVTDHHAVHHHEETIAMVTVGCLILGMLVFLLAMVYIRRITRQLPVSRDIDNEADMQKPYKIDSSKIVHEPLPSMKFQSLINLLVINPFFFSSAFASQPPQNQISHV